MPNRLIKEQSPYLLQHAHNPVDWYAWGDEPFERAKAENKPVIISIGYAACHWCHVMEKESFEHAETAAYMNQHFINIKVDREEHPGVDHLYMDAVQAISGSGGWPLNVFATPDRVPFYGGTYFPPRPAFNRPSWIQVLMQMHEIWDKQKDEVATQAQQMIQYLQQASRIATGQTETWDMKSCEKIAETLLQQADKVKGGFGNAPKFPGTMAISYLLEHYHFTKSDPALKQALLSLDAMIEGGIYDQLGGGFSRYATDANWLVPHFEKMLYDNALLICSLCDAYSITKREKYKRIIDETIAFAERELKDDAGGYYCALDADSEGIEGKYYTWTWDEWLNALNWKNDIAAAHYFGISEEGNWEGTNILHVAKSIDAIATTMHIPMHELQTRINTVKQILFAEREKRIRPQTDDKSLLSWNALMNIALTKAGIVLQDDVYLKRAEEHMQWMLQQYEKDDMLLHASKNRKARIMANLDDYAYLIQALLQLGSATGNNDRIKQAAYFTEAVINNFKDEESPFFYYTSNKQKDIPVRKVDVYDGATPSANAVMAHNLLILGQCMERNEWLEQGLQMLQKITTTAIRYPYSFAYWGILLQRYAAGMKMAICRGNEADKSAKKLFLSFLPQLFILTSKKEIFELPVFKDKFFSDGTLIFVCTQQACLSPVSNINEALHLINQ